MSNAHNVAHMLHMQMQKNVEETLREERRSLLGCENPAERQRKIESEAQLAEASEDITSSLQHTRQLMAQVDDSLLVSSFLLARCTWNSCFPVGFSACRLICKLISRSLVTMTRSCTVRIIATAGDLPQIIAVELSDPSKLISGFLMHSHQSVIDIYNSCNASPDHALSVSHSKPKFPQGLRLRGFS